MDSEKDYTPKNSNQAQIAINYNIFSILSYLQASDIPKLINLCKPTKEIIEKKTIKWMLFGESSLKHPNGFHIKNLKQSDNHQTALFSEIYRSPDIKLDRDLEIAGHSSHDFTQTPEKTLDASQNISIYNQNFWSSKGSDKPNVTEYIIYAFRDSKVGIIESISIRFYQERQFPVPNDYFPATSVKFHFGCFPHQYDYSTEELLVSDHYNGQNNKIRVDLPHNYVCKYLKVELIGKSGVQLSDRKYYTCIDYLILKGKTLDLQNSPSVNHSLSNYYEEHQGTAQRNEFLKDIFSFLPPGCPIETLAASSTSDFFDIEKTKMFLVRCLQEIKPTDNLTAADFVFKYQILRKAMEIVGPLNSSMQEKEKYLKLIEKIGCLTLPETKLVVGDWIQNEYLPVVRRVKEPGNNPFSDHWRQMVQNFLNMRIQIEYFHENYYVTSGPGLFPTEIHRLMDIMKDYEPYLKHLKENYVAKEVILKTDDLGTIFRTLYRSSIKMHEYGPILSDQNFNIIDDEDNHDLD